MFILSLSLSLSLSLAHTFSHTHPRALTYFLTHSIHLSTHTEHNCHTTQQSLSLNLTTTHSTHSHSLSRTHDLMCSYAFCHYTHISSHIYTQSHTVTHSNTARTRSHTHPHAFYIHIFSLSSHLRFPRACFFRDSIAFQFKYDIFSHITRTNLNLSVPNQGLEEWP